MAARRASSGHTGVRVRRELVEIRVPWRGDWVWERVDVPRSPQGIARAARLRADAIEKSRLGILIWREFFPRSRRAEPAPVSTVPTLDDACAQYLRHCRATMSPSTVRGYEKSLSIWRAALGPEPVTAIRRSQVLDVVTIWEWSGRTLSNRLTPLRAVFDMLIDDEIEGMARNPAMRIKKRGSPRPPPTPLLPDEIARALAACEAAQPAWLPYWQVAIGTGLRTSEQIALRWPSVDLPGRSVRVRARRVEQVDEQTTKTGRERDVELTDLAARGLRAQREQRLRWGDQALRQDSVFLHPRTLEPIRDDLAPRRSWDRMLRDAGIPHRKAYASRHTYACTLLAAGVPLLRVSELLGHASPRMTLEHYARWVPSEGVADVPIRSVTALA